VAAAGRDPPPDLGVMVDNKSSSSSRTLRESRGYGGEEEEEEKKKAGEQRWVSSAPSWLAKSPSPTPKPGV
jgi:hypothetical protein